jgi:hypothetical protein
MKRKKDSEKKEPAKVSNDTPVLFVLKRDHTHAGVDYKKGDTISVPYGGTRKWLKARGII